MKIVRILFLEDFAFEEDQSLSSFSNLLWLQEYIKIEIRPAWVFGKEMLFEKIIENLSWLRNGDVIFLSSHGSSGKLFVGQSVINLDMISTNISRRGKGVRLFISSCAFFDIAFSELDRLQKSTLFYEIAGYLDNVSMKRDFRFEREFLLNWLGE